MQDHTAERDTNRHNGSNKMTSLDMALCVGLLVALSLVSSLKAEKPRALARQTGTVSAQVLSLDGQDWRVAADPKNVGRTDRWYEAARPDAKPTPVPGIVQNVFPDFHGPAWYYREFGAPVNPHANGRFVFRFGAVDWAAEVWVNGRAVGKHEGGETPFALEATEAVKPGQRNLLAVRVLNPFGQKIDGYTGNDTPQHHRSNSIQGGCLYNSSGILNAVELLVVPAIYLADVHVMPDWKTGEILTRATVNSATDKAEMLGDFAVEPAAGGGSIASSTRAATLKAGDNVVEATVRVPGHHLWTPDDPFLYRVSVGVRPAGSTSVHQESVRCGFRDFRFENGYLRLNGRRIVLFGTYYVPLFPITYVFPHDPELLRRDVANHKKYGFNFMRVFSGRTLSQMMDLCDEMGLMVYQEHYGAWWGHADTPVLTGRWNRSVLEVVRRDRNHPSVIVWGLLNEMGHPKYLNDVLPMIRELDPTRMVWSNSAGGRPSNPGGSKWDEGLTDCHPYFRAPLSDRDIASIRGDKGRKAGDKRRVFVTEGGWLVARDMPSDLAQFHRLGKDQHNDALYWRQLMDAFMADWKQWKLDETWKRPEDYFTDAHRNGARVRERAETAFRSLPGLVGLSPTQKIGDQDYDGGGLTTFFREPKVQELSDGARLANAPLRWCLFVTPSAFYRGRPVRLEAVLADTAEALKAGNYPVHVEVLGSDRKAVLTRDVTVALGESAPGKERPLTASVFDEEVSLDVPAGAYEMVVTMAGRKDIPGGRITFHVGDAKAMPAMPAEAVLWGRDAALSAWLTGNGVKVVPFDAPPAKRQVIVVGGKAPEQTAKGFGDLARSIAKGCGAVFVDVSVFTQGKARFGWPMVPQPAIGRSEGHPLFRADHWAKKHDLFEGLPAGGMIDGNPLYAHLITKTTFRTREPPKPTPTAGGVIEVVAGSICTSQGGYSSGIQMAVCELGAGRFILHTMKIAPNLGEHPAADRLLRNMVNYAARDCNKPVGDLPADFDKQLKAMGYE